MTTIYGVYQDGDYEDFMLLEIFTSEEAAKRFKKRWEKARRAEDASYQKAVINPLSLHSDGNIPTV